MRPLAPPTLRPRGWTCALALTAAGCGGGGGRSPVPSPPPPTNVLVVVLDDWGIDMLGRFGAHPDAPPTPTLDALAEEGVLFRRAYVSPTCSPTRSQILTGRHSFRTGIGEPVNDWQSVHGLPLDEVTLPEVLARAAPRPVATSAVGKWHLGSLANGDLDHPNLQGFDWFGGPLGNFFFGANFTSYTKVVNGAAQPNRTYATTEQVDDALERIAAMPQPWFLYLSFSAPHKPFHVPPAALHTYSLAGDPELTPNEHYKAAVQAVDTELGRLLASMTAEVRANTMVFVLGDNGTPNEAVTPPAVNGQNKGTLYEGGVHVPLIVWGKHVAQPGRESDALLHAADLFPTLAELFGADYRAGIGDARPVDGLSFLPLLLDPAAPPARSSLFLERFTPNGFGPYTSQGWSARDARWKLIRRPGQTDLFFDLAGRVREGEALDVSALDPEQQAAYDALAAELAAMLGG